MRSILALVFLARGAVAAITIDYPADGSIFPPEITPPTFAWRDSAKTATRWRIEVAFADGSAPVRAAAKGARMRIGPVDPRCEAETNQPPRLAPRQASARTWTPDRAAWEAIKKRSVAAPATITITGYRGAERVSRGRAAIRTSRDPVGAPIFYRDVPLMPSETETGVIKPLAASAVPLVAWRLRNIAEPDSRVVMDNLPVCANCHSFSRDGKTLGMDLDGLQNNKGMYFLANVAPRTSVRRQDVIQWRSAGGRLKGGIRVGFMSQVSPDGQYVVTTINDSTAKDPPSNYYVANFKDYRFLQVFYPARGILAWYSRATGILQPLPGADDPRFVQMGAVWSPDGKYLVFARAGAGDPAPPGLPPAKFANDPNELQVRYDLYRVPFNEGRGGRAEPIAGASGNGMSNTFPKVSPDGRWIVFVRCRNGQLMRPDSQLYIVPSGGGEARRMRANTPLMNSWHSFSPNGRWLVFSSKAESPYTRMYLTHIDEEGNDSPAIRIDNATAANRAVNIPEFVNVAPDGLRAIGGPALEYYRLVDRAVYFQKQKQFSASAAWWQKALEAAPDDATAHENLGMALLLSGRREESAEHLQKAREIRLRAALETDPANATLHNELGMLLLHAGRKDEAIGHFRRANARANLAIAQGDWRGALAIDPDNAEAHAGLAAMLYRQGRSAEALQHWREAVRLEPNNAAVLREAARALATCPDVRLRNGREAVELARRAVELTGGKDQAALEALAAARAEAER